MGCVDYCTQLDYCLIQQITDNTVARGRSVTWPHIPLVQVQFSSVYICITELSGIDNIGLGIELELPSSELEMELNCLNDFVPDSELNWNCYYRNCNRIAKTELTPALVLSDMAGSPSCIKARTSTFSPGGVTCHDRGVSQFTDRPRS